jgi:hypothetical protein
MSKIEFFNKFVELHRNDRIDNHQLYIILGNLVIDGDLPEAIKNKLNSYLEVL